MIQFTHSTTRYSVTEANAPRIRAALEKPYRHKFIGLSPVKYAYPIFTPGMTTADYVKIFNSQFDGIRVTLDHDCPNYHAPAPMLDATQPEVVEEIDPDYVEQAPAPKRKAATAAQLRKALENIAAIKPMATANTHDLWLAIGEIHRIAEGALQ